MFTDRAQAGRLLAQALRHLRRWKPLILALPRGGVPVALEIARAMQAPLGLALARKIGAPGHSELAIGAIADGADPVMVTDPRLIADYRLDEAWLMQAQAEALREIARRRALYLAGLPDLTPQGRVVIVVDDGIATGATMRAALRSLHRQGAKRLVLAVPVAAPQALAMLEAEADEIVCLESPPHFMAVGQFYRSFPQLEDREVIDQMREAATISPHRPA